MWKKLARIALIAALAALALLACAAGLSRLIWHRSLQATLYERLCARRYATTRTADEEVARLAEKLRAGEQTYEIPEDTPFTVRVERGEREGMAFFTLNAHDDAPVGIFYLHGGAYVGGFNAYQWRLMNRLAEDTGAEIVAPDYHRAPFGNCAQAYSDVGGLYRDYAGAHPGRRIVLMGDSAGGGLALGLAEALAREGGPLPERLVLFSPWVDLTMENPDIADYVAVDPILHLPLVKVHGRAWADDLDPHDWRASPLFGDMAGLPSVTLYAGTRELLYPDLLLLNDALTAAGVEVDFHVGRGLNHEYPLMPIPEGKRAVREVEALLLGQS